MHDTPLTLHLCALVYILTVGPVRGIDFHYNQPLFVSGGDDYKIKVTPTLYAQAEMMTCTGVLSVTHQLAPA